MAKKSSMDKLATTQGSSKKKSGGMSEIDDIFSTGPSTTAATVSGSNEAVKKGKSKGKDKAVDEGLKSTVSKKQSMSKDEAVASSEVTKKEKKRKRSEAESTIVTSSSSTASNPKDTKSDKAKLKKPKSRAVQIITDTSNTIPIHTAPSTLPTSTKSSSSSRPSSAAVQADDLDEFTDSRGTTRKRTEDGLRIFTAEELKLGQGGDTPDCPFDCQCCKYSKNIQRQPQTIPGCCQTG
ncbi:uncharacterized protein UTRI_03123_B [Ustilago trichophora]|uniref:DUF1764-domain-containing protein n=1 Tax=Ustilago trichophora TaxID=86804 RepID=A0A5C3E770_9BASI|nr:uncharacterized protein UTRI_03123_B [Ustilago trichophora]